MMKPNYIFFLLFVALSSCVSDKQLGDRELQVGNYKKAIDYYDLEISSGSNDPEVFVNAARASVQMGSFGSAERYYGKAISNGGGVSIAKELARFYVKTSNYGSAIRVYHYLLGKEKEKQPIYNNLGTAYLYSGSPFEAESYLLIAQQLDPSDPFPYLNLGWLYDQSLKNPPKAMGFYTCFLTLAPSHESSPKVSQRLNELENAKHIHKEIDCTRPYKETTKTLSLTEFRKKISVFEKQKKNESSSSNPQSRVKIIQTKEDVLAVKFVNPSREIKSAVTFYESKDFQNAENAFKALPMKFFSADVALAYGDTLVHLQKYREATSWLQIAEKKNAQPNTVKLLIQSTMNSGAHKEVGFWCDKYRNRPAFEDALRMCKPPQKEPSKTESPLGKTEEKTEKKVIKEESDSVIRFVPIRNKKVK